MCDRINQEAIIQSQFENFDWNQLSLEQLKLLQSQINKAIHLKQNALKPGQPGDRGTQDYYYKASLAKVFPHRSRHHLSEYQSCIFIVSLGSKNFIHPKRLNASIEWISEHFNTCLVLIADSIYRLTLNIRGQAKADNHWSKALQAGQEFLSENTRLFQQYPESCNFAFKLTSDIEKQPNFEVYHQQFQRLYQTSESFTKLVNGFVETYLGRRETSAGTVNEFLDRQRQLAIAYLLEESALFSCLAQAGWTVFVYPGSIKTFEEIAEGLHPKVPLALQQMIWVSLRLKKKTTGL